MYDIYNYILYTHIHRENGSLDVVVIFAGGHAITS